MSQEDRMRMLLEQAAAIARPLGVEPLTFSREAPGGCVAGDVLLGADLREALADFGAQWRDGDPRAAASEWTKAYFRVVIPPLLAAAFAGIEIAAMPSDLWIRIEAGRPAAIHLRNRGIVAGGSGGPESGAVDIDRLYGVLLGRNAASVATAVGPVSGLVPRVVWSNLGTLLAFAYRKLAERPELATEAARHAEGVLARAEVPWFEGRNPLLNPVRGIPVGIPGIPPVAHIRRVCCLRDRLGEALCLSCPRLTQDGRISRYRDLLALRAGGKD